MTDLQRLIDAWLDGETTPSIQGELNQQLSASDEAAQVFARDVALQYLLRDAVLTENSVPLAVSRSLGDPLDNQNAIPSPAPRAASQRTLRLAGVGVALAATAVALVMLAAPFGGAPKPTELGSTRNAIAVIDPASTARAEGFPEGRIFAGARVQFDEGRMTLKFSDDAVVTLEGDVDFEVESSMRAILHHGQLTATVSETGRGFTIATPQTDVVDLGTRFGVSVGADRQSEVVVFDGQVDIGGSQEGSRQRLVAGEALRLEEGGQQSRIAMIWQRSSGPGMEWSSASEYDTGSTIASVSDNLSKASRPKFYSVTPRGFLDNARAYVDRPYVWGGWGGQDLPGELKGGDYIQTFNSDKKEGELEIRVGISKPARMYVLFDTREETPPEWLRSSFTRASFEVALRADTEAYKKALALASNRPDDPSVTNATNSNYTEYRFSVWQRDVLASDEIRLGVNASISSRSMYGVVVVPR
jgi:ferric-dicitrate binding protein FerR (iron transport regulator)